MNHFKAPGTRPGALSLAAPSFRTVNSGTIPRVFAGHSTANGPQTGYAFCWEDADVLLAGAGELKGARCLSIASGGENTLAILSREPDEVIAFDTNPAQLHLLRLKVAAFAELSYDEMLHFLGVRPCTSRLATYRKLRRTLPFACRQFWDTRLEMIEAGVINTGKFESYFRIFRELVLPLVHRKGTVESLLAPKERDDRHAFYRQTWNTPAWRLLFKLFFSRKVMALLGRSRDHFKFVSGPCSEPILRRTIHALTELDPSVNPYLHFLLLGTLRAELPAAYRKENFRKIQNNLSKLRYCHGSLEQILQRDNDRFDFANLSDIFEYMPEQEYLKQLRVLAGKLSEQGKILYWNMLADRESRNRIDGLNCFTEKAGELHYLDRAFFYSKLVIEGREK